MNKTKTQKKRILVTAIILIPLTASTAYAGAWEKWTSIGNKTLPTKTYNIEASGWDVRVITWTPPDAPNVSCVFAAGSKKGGVACYPKQIK